MELFRYISFISYSRKDKRFADLLHQRLERTRVPVSGRGALERVSRISLLDKERRFRPICQDTKEFKAGALSEEIRAFLRASASLIVIASPHAAASEYVQQEIQYFIELGRGDRIFFVVPEGVDPTLTADEVAQTCIPAPFLTANPNPLWADARRREAFRYAKMQIVAGVLDGKAPAKTVLREAAQR